MNRDGKFTGMNSKGAKPGDMALNPKRSNSHSNYS